LLEAIGIEPINKAFAELRGAREIYHARLPRVNSYREFRIIISYFYNKDVNNIELIKMSWIEFFGNIVNLFDSGT